YSVTNTCGGNWVTGATSGIWSPEPGGGCGDEWYIASYPRSGESRTLEIGMKNDADDHIALMPSGNVGIGITTPAQKLDVDGYVRMRSINGEGGTIQLDGNNGTTMWVENINGSLRFINSPWNAELFSVDQSGNARANAFLYYSDRRLKDDIKPIDNALSKLLQ